MIALDTHEQPRAPTFSVIKSQRAFQAVCLQIRREIAVGNLRPGDRLPPERVLAETFGVSRAAIREAMRSLENAGLVHCQQGMGGGIFIRESGSDAVMQAVADMVMLGQIPADSVTEARIILTEQAIHLACQHGTDADFAAIENDIDHCERLTAEGRFDRRTTYITEFYRVLAQATHNQVIVVLVASVTELTRELLARVGSTPRNDVIAVRRRVLAHLRARDPASAAREMRAHLERLHAMLGAAGGHSAGRGSVTA